MNKLIFSLWHDLSDEGQGLEVIPAVGLVVGGGQGRVLVVRAGPIGVAVGHVREPLVGQEASGLTFRPRGEVIPVAVAPCVAEGQA